MASKVFSNLALCAATLVSLILSATVGCQSDPKASLPTAQADAVTKLEAAGVKAPVRDGKVNYVDFYAVQDTVGSVVHVAELPDLEKVNLSSTNVGDDGLAHLAKLSQLKELGLTNTKVTDKGLEHLAGLTNLTVLSLNGCDVTDAGLVHLKNLKELKQLHLNETKVSDAGLTHLADLDKLESLLLFGTPVTSSGAAAFRKENGDINVVTSEGEGDASAESDGG